MSTQKSQWFIRSLLAVWALVMIVVGSSLMVDHWIALPHPMAGDEEWAAELVSNRTATVARQWTAFHFLYNDCPCSRRVLDRVIESAPNPQVIERIVLIGESADVASRAVGQGYEFDCVSPEQLKSKYGVESAPMFVVIDPSGIPCYSGGYTSRKQGFDIQHAQIIADVISRKHVESLPVYGCAVSDGLKRIVDPLKLKYKSNPSL